MNSSTLYVVYITVVFFNDVEKQLNYFFFEKIIESYSEEMLFFMYDRVIKNNRLYSQILALLDKSGNDQDSDVERP